MPNYLASWQPLKRRDARAAEWTGLENRSRGNSTGGSNPPLSAISLLYRHTLHQTSRTALILTEIGTRMRRKFAGV